MSEALPGEGGGMGNKGGELGGLWRAIERHVCSQRLLLLCSFVEDAFPLPSSEIFCLPVFKPAVPSKERDVQSHSMTIA